jgi:hypothetical protein
MGGGAVYNSFPRPLGFIYLLIAAGLAVAFVRSDYRFARVKRFEWRWLGREALAGLAVAVGLSVPMAIGIHVSRMPAFLNMGMLVEALLRIPQQMGYAAVTEEPFFRAFLWGYLRKAGWKHGWILLFQALLFVLAHVYTLKDFPISFWVIVPVGAVALGLLVWRSRTLVSSLAAHAMPC